MTLPHLLLGMVSQPITGYEIKRAFDTSLRHFWTAELSQIYPALRALEQRGLLESERQPSPVGPARCLYRRTPDGTRELHEWLCADPVSADTRLPYLGQLCFQGELRDADASERFLIKLRDTHAARVDALRAVEQAWFPDPDALSDDDFYAHLTLKFGLARVESSLATCDAALVALTHRRSKST